MANLSIYLCGTVCKKTGTAGIGTIAQIDGETVLLEKGEYVGTISRNEASYLVLNKVLEQVSQWTFGPVEIFTDNELMFKQLRGTFDVRDKKLKLLHERALKMLDIVPKAKLGLVNRDGNRQAYELAKVASDPEKADTVLLAEGIQESPVRWKVVAFTPKLMVVEFTYPKGAILPMHKHFHEQASYLLKGKLKYIVAGRDVLLTKGTGLAITGYSEHQIEALADSIEIVSYYPMRFDLLPKPKEEKDNPASPQVQTILFG